MPASVGEQVCHATRREGVVNRSSMPLFHSVLLRAWGDKNAGHCAGKNVRARTFLALMDARRGHKVRAPAAAFPQKLAVMATLY